LIEWSCVLVAAGRGSRQGGPAPKQFLMLGGLPVWFWSARIFDRLFLEGTLAELVVVHAAGEKESFRPWIEELSIPVILTEGGSQRWNSVLNGLSNSSGTYAMVHDAARPFLTEGLCRRLMAAVDEDIGAVPCVPVRDSLKIAGDDGVVTTSPIDRTILRAAQTPQCFPRAALFEALSRQGACADEAEAWCAQGSPLREVRGESGNFKITYAEDFDMASSMAENRTFYRTGFGFDVHPLTPGNGIVLGGISIRSALCSQGHSDGDGLCHAISDALLGAAGLPDVGVLFPASDSAYRGAYSLDLLRDAVALVDKEGWSVEWVDAVIHIQEPRLAEFTDQITRNLDGVLAGIGPAYRPRVNVKVKSGELSGVVGNSEAFQCFAIATLRKERPADRQAGDQ